MRKWLIVILPAIFLAAADQLTKLAVVKWVAPKGNITLIPDFFNFTYLVNTGMAFGIMNNGRSTARILMFTAATVAALLAIGWFIHTAKEKENLLLGGLALISGGAVGNMIDRLRAGQVVDFIDVHIGRYHWPSFNVADAAITIGAIILLLHFWLTRKDEDTEEETA